MTNDVDWLSDDEMDAWLGLGAVAYLLPQALDRQLRRDFGISHSYYTILACTSDAPDGAITMGELAQRAWVSPSRLTHAVGKLEERGWMERVTSPTNRRVQIARLTETGWGALREMAPTHLAEVRRAVFDHLDAEDVAHLARITGRIRDALQTDET
ncbi:MarR family winged helix-turn-helix transcriptional regulator [Nocardioides yefusunii]|uniref:MarR family winged helix-turn-helix transcriptional regulator n=1 Tax=Nocardioides yefusunii TaxID=2500546 RepID=A0ABW1QV99_9ACTN|nr:MarR family transcriptional regulator [Nocardioides yefusunii]